MPIARFRGPSDIKYYVKQWIQEHSEQLAGKHCIDLPAGEGVSCELLKQAGANVSAYDLFPEFFQCQDMSCQQADLSQTLPIDGETADYVLCQEGIEHIPDQLFLLKEFNRILKPGGRLLLTTPNYSNLLSRTSYLLGESETFKQMAPNELDSIWHNSTQQEQLSIYYGHIFLIGFQKLRLLSKIAGFRIKTIIPTRCCRTALALFPLQYPFIVLSQLNSYIRMRRRHKQTPDNIKHVYRELLRYAIDPKILLCKHLFIEFEKTSQPEEALHPYFEFTAAPA